MTTSPGQQTTWLTQAAYDRLSAELEDAKGPRRADIVAKIEAARDEGDLKENGGYHAAKDEQGKQEARIRQLEQMLEEAQIGAAGDVVVDGKVHSGMVVTAEVAGDEMVFLLGSREIADTTDIDVYSEKSPLGAAIEAAAAQAAAARSAPIAAPSPIPPSVNLPPPAPEDR